MMPSGIALALLCVAASFIGTGCRGHQTDRPPVPTAVAPLRTQLDAPPVGPLAFDDAVRRLVERHPELQAIRAEARAVDLDPGRFGVEFEMRGREGSTHEIALASEVLSLFGYGPRNAERCLALALRDELRRRHHERARALVGELAVAYATYEALMGLPPVPAGPDLEAWRAAGLATDALEAAVAGVEEGLRSEATLRDVETRRAQLAVGVLVGGMPGWAVEPLAAPAVSFPPTSMTTGAVAAEAEQKLAADRLLLARGDLWTLAGRVDVAEREVRLAAQRQWPDIMLRLGLEIEPATPLNMVAIALPLDGPRKVAAAVRARDAALARLREGVFRALAEAAAAALDAEGAVAALAAAEANAAVVASVRTAEEARLETDANGLASWVDVAGREVGTLREVREARIRVARARVEAARAAGWPSAATVERAR